MSMLNDVVSSEGITTLSLDLSDADSVQSLYSTILKRDADSSGLSAWVAALQSGTTLAEVRTSLINSAEASATIDPLVRLYEAAFGRVPDDAGLAGWAAEMRAGKSFLEIAEGFTGSQEFADRYPEAANGDLSGFITALYQRTLGRDPEAAGLEGWLNSGQSTAEILVGFSESLEFHSRSEAKVSLYLSAVGQGNTPSAAFSMFQLGSASDLTGNIIDGKVAGATVGIDLDGDGIIGPGEPTVTTDALGNFEFPEGTPLGNLVATGGTDISTGLPFTGRLEAPAGSTVVTPLTTMVQKLANLDTDDTKTPEEKAADAQTQLKSLLGLSSIGADLTQTDFVTEATEGDTSGADGLSDLEASQLYAASVQILTIVAQGAAAITGADNSVGDQAAADAVFAALAAGLNNQAPGTEVDLTSSTATDDDPTNDAGDLLTSVIRQAADDVLDGEAQSRAEDIADSAAKIAASANREVQDTIDSLSTIDPLDPNFGSQTTDTLVRIVQTQKVVQGEAADDLEAAAGSSDPDAAADSLADTIGNSDGSGFNDESIIDNQNIGDVDGDGTEDDDVAGDDNADDDLIGDGPTTPVTPVDPGPTFGPVAVLNGATVTLNDVTGQATMTVSGTDAVFTSGDGRTSVIALDAFDAINLGGHAMEMSGATVDELFEDSSSGEIDITGFAAGGTFNISDVDFGNIQNENLQSPNVWLSDQKAEEPDRQNPQIAGFSFSELEGQQSILPEGLTVNGTVREAFMAWWDSFDDYYVGGQNFYNDFINQRFVFLGNDYAEYLRGGGEAFLDVVKTSSDYTNRQQTLHDNLLGNLGNDEIGTRFESEDTNTYNWPELGDPRTDDGRFFGERPLPSGNNNTLVTFDDAKDWDAENGINRSDANLEILIGELSDIAHDDGEMYMGDGNSADNFRIVRIEDSEIELGIKAKIRGVGDYADSVSTDLLNESYYNEVETTGATSAWAANWSFDFSVSTNIDDTNGEAPLLSDYVFKLVFDVDPTEDTSLVTYVLDDDDATNWLFESAEDPLVSDAVEFLAAAVGDFLQVDNNRIIIGDNELNPGAEVDGEFVSQNSQNYGFGNSFEAFVNTFLGNAYEADGSRIDGTDYWEAEADAGHFWIGLEAYTADGATLLGQNFIVVDSVVEVVR